MRGYTAEQARAAIAASQSLAEALRRLGLRAAGGNHRSLRRFAELNDISTAHLSSSIRSHRGSGTRPLSEVMVEHSTYHRGHLEERLYREGLKQRRCELCGQGEEWRGRRMALILDHINGVADDHRLENLRVLCPNCAATLDTHCGRQNRRVWPPQPCPGCGRAFAPKRAQQRFCTRACWVASRVGSTRPDARRVERPPYARLKQEVRTLGWSATGRLYGVSDNAIRKWVARYEFEAGRERPPPPAASQPPVVPAGPVTPLAA